MPAPVLLDITPLARAHANRGIGAVVRGLLSGLATLPVETRPTLLVTRRQLAPDGFEAERVRWPTWSIPRIPDPWPTLVLERAIRRMPPRAFHATQADLVPQSRGRPVIVTCYDLIPLHRPLRNPLARSRYGTYLRRLAQADHVIAISEATAADVTASLGVPSERISVVPLGLPASPEPHGPTPTAPYLLYANSIEPHKNPGVLIDALAHTHHDIHLVMCGVWSERRRMALERHVANRGVTERVHMMGYVPADRLAALRRDAAAVVVPSILEGFGLPVLEALAAGTPVLAANIPALHEAGGEIASYLDPTDPTAWARAADRLLEDPAGRAAAHDHGPGHAARFTWERTAELTTDVWRDVLVHA